VLVGHDYVIAAAPLFLQYKFLHYQVIVSSNGFLSCFTNQNQMKEEVARYRKYLEEQAQKEREREKAFEAIVIAELEKQWRVRVEQWKKEREARRKLMQEVMETRKKQIQEQSKYTYVYCSTCKGTVIMNECNSKILNSIVMTYTTIFAHASRLIMANRLSLIKLIECS